MIGILRVGGLSFRQSSCAQDDKLKNEGRVSRKVIPDPGLVLLQLGVEVFSCQNLSWPRCSAWPSARSTRPSVPTEDRTA